MNHNQNWTLKFTRRSSWSDGHYVRMDDDRITPKRLAGGLAAVGAFVMTFVVLAQWF